MSSNIKTFWDNSHSRKILSDLSGCQYDETIDFLKVRNYISPGKHVLEIGVGLGYVTKGLYESGAIVSALDISEIALDCVKGFCEHLFLVSDSDKLPSNYFDVVVCHNVIQHVPTYLLIKELEHIMRSLKTSGVFALEFVSNDLVDDTWTIKYVYPGHGLPGFCRKPAYLERLINGVGGICELVVDRKCSIGEVKGCHVFHIRRAINV